MMEEFLPRQHKMSFVVLLMISLSQRCCQFFSSPLSLGTCCAHDSAALVLCANKGAGKVLLIYFLSLSICLSYLMPLTQVQSLQPKHLPRLFPIPLHHPTLKSVGGFCPFACLVHRFPSKINILFLLGKNPKVGISIQDNNSINKSNINSYSNCNNDNKGTSQEIGCFG